MYLWLYLWLYPLLYIGLRTWLMDSTRPPSLLPRHACPGWLDDQLSSLDLVAEDEQQAKTLVGLLNRLVLQCRDEKTVRK